MQTCTREQCSGHGSCADAGTCACFGAYAGAVCADCASGFQDRDGDGECRAACSSTTCAGRGSCSDATGEALCTCLTGYAGQTCASCAAGWQDNDSNGSCAPDFAHAGVSCNARAACEDRSGVATCACLSGYQGPNCDWVGVVADPGFTLATAGWSLQFDAGFSQGTGAFDPGLLMVPQGPNTRARVIASQVVTLPPSMVPFAIDTAFLDATRSGLVARLGNQTVVFPVDDTSSLHIARTACLSELLPPGMTQLSVSSLQSAGVGVGGGEVFKVDHLSLRPAPECPAPGTVKNGDFSSTDGWVFEGATGVDPLSHSLQFRPQICADQSRARGQVSIPSAAANPMAAIRLTSRRILASGQSDTLHIGLAQRDRTLVGLTSGWSSTTVCPAADFRGKSIEVEVSAYVLGVCAPGSLGVDVDDVEVVSEPRCAVRNGFVDPGFEWGGVGWSINAGNSPNSFEIVDQYQNGKVLELRRDVNCQIVVVSQPFTSPQPVAGRGPAVKFRYQSTTQSTLTYVVAGRSGTLAPAAAWTQANICLPPAGGGLPQLLILQHQSGASNCGAPAPNSRSQLDDFELTTDSSCPAQ